MIWQIIITIFGLTAFIFFLKALREVNNKRNIFGLTHYLFFFGSFVWGDLIVLGPFWIIAVIFSLVLNDVYLFLLIVSLFWVVRSLGEIIYWLNEQFAVTKRNPPHTLRFHKLFKGEAVWFIYQLFWQCIFVVAIISSLYFAKLWLSL